MTQYRKAYNPCLKGIRPRRFFFTIKEQSSRSLGVKDAREFDLDWEQEERDGGLGLTINFDLHHKRKASANAEAFRLLYLT